MAAALLGGAAYVTAQIDRRDAQITSLTADNSDLQNARSALQDDVGRLTAERTELLRTRDSLQGQLADAKAQNDQLVADRDRLQAEADRLRKENDALNQKLSAPPPTPSPAPAPTGVDRAAVARVLGMDDQIEQKFGSFYEQLQNVLNSFNRGDLLGAQAGYQRASQTGEQIKELFRSRDTAAEALR